MIIGCAEIAKQKCTGCAADNVAMQPSKLETLTQCWFNVVPAS